MIKLGHIYKVIDKRDNPYIPQIAIPVKRITPEQYRKLIEPYLPEKDKERESYYEILDVKSPESERGLWREGTFVMNYEELK